MTIRPVLELILLIGGTLRTYANCRPGASSHSVTPFLSRVLPSRAPTITLLQWSAPTETQHNRLRRRIAGS